MLDGAYIARRLRDIEEVMNGPILDELRDDRASSRDWRPADAAQNVEPLLKPHRRRARAGPAEPRLAREEAG